MPVVEEVVVRITCDNSACPGNELDPADRTGWLFISSEVYGQLPVQHVFCSQSCVNAATGPGVEPQIFQPEQVVTPVEPTV